MSSEHPPGQTALNDNVGLSDGKTDEAEYNKFMMRRERSLLNKIKSLFFPSDQPSREGDKEVIPFFILITAAIIWMYAVYIRQIEQVYLGVIFTLLMFVHLVLYWSIFRFIHSTRQTRLYFAFQGMLAFILVLIGGDFGLSIGLYSSLIGNAVGALRKNKDVVIVIFAYILLTAISIIILAGYEVILQWSYIAIPSILFSAFIAFMFRRQLEIREKTQTLLDELKTAHAQLAAYTEQVEELTLAAERQRMARELHDTLSQGLAGLILQLEAVSTHIEKQNSQRAQQILHSAMSQSRSTLAEARQVIDDLRSGEQSQESFTKEVQREAQQLQAISGIPCEVVINITRPLPAEVQSHLRKIISEGMYNIAKHSQAKQAWMRLTENTSHLVLEIEDDGSGFVPETGLVGDGHYGLLGIQERVALLGGEFSLDSQPNQGTCLLVQIPVNPHGERNV